ncbi:TonB-dependent receptor [Novosphingobium sp. G106]|uniref:TonB-dependent receptor n=1 Tax=Novosphingobium sp. G106 TaxID=2849500 RepID=UPI001C2DCDE6|nr:TonB-dependent receptor [Novosphingobium sp. G106]MBV1688698.1 TonB-dependent receptor [Novosphingobium sp. G106]
MLKFKNLAFASVSLLTLTTPALAQTADEAGTSSGDIIVTARRVEERLQDVPISISVFNQQQLANRNVTSATDLANYTPSLSSNNNFGEDNTTFAIRGFAQDTGTAPSVGTYFGDVVTPRGASNGQPIGDGASVGDFFDLQNVQVLKGPQGTLFGRNTTGGAVLFVPQKPTDKLEGYVEGGIGNYDQRRIQAVVNLPLADTFRVRLGVDHQVRDGYLKNTGGIGPDRFEDMNYWAARLSIVGDLTPNLENYVIASYSHSKNNGAMDKEVAADATQGLFGAFAAAQLARQGSGFYDIQNAIPNAGLRTEQWQVINTTTWKAGDTLTVKNIASYAQLKQSGNSPIFGNLWLVPAGGVVYPTNFEQSASPPGLDSANESTFTEELRLAGNSLDNRLSWQAGAYLEVVRPLGTVGSQSPGFSNCGNGNGADFQCTDPFRGLIADEFGIPAAFAPSVGNINYTVGTTSFHDVGLYGQATYKLTEQFKLTGGLRYTWDHETIDTVQKVFSIAAPPAFGATGFKCTNPLADANCNTHFFTSSHKPTWLIDLDYTPSRDLLIYGKYARGYRSATIAPNIPEGGTAAAPDTSLNYVRPEKVDSFEVGAKTSFSGAVHGNFNVALFYNKFSNQQLQVGFLPIDPSAYPQTAAPVNAGKSKIYGAEVEASLTPFKGLDLTLGYSYLRTRIDQVVATPSNPAYNTQPAFVVGDPEVLSPRNKLIAGATYTLPLDESIGKLSIGGSVTYRDKMLSNYIDRTNPNPSIATLSYLPKLTLVDANVNWTGVAGSPVDLGFFVTNLTNKKYYTYVAGLGSPQLGFENASIGEPRMYGVTLKVRFGQ